MKILVVGGTGYMGGGAATLLREEGHDITIAGRTRPDVKTPMHSMPFLQRDYVKGEFSTDDLKGFDALVFSAAHDFRHIDMKGDSAGQLTEANTEALPRFFKMAREAGVRRAVYIGSFYAHVVEDQANANAYVKSRITAGQRVIELDEPGFEVIVLDVPFIVGQLPGMGCRTVGGDPAYALGLMPDIPDFAPEGGSNFLSLRSFAEAVSGALARGQHGATYLIGDENLSYKEYLEEYFSAAERPRELEVRSEWHPLLPDGAVNTGFGTVSYEPRAEHVALLGYRRNDVRRSIHEIVAAYSEEIPSPMNWL